MGNIVGMIGSVAGGPEKSMGAGLNLAQAMSDHHDARQERKVIKKQHARAQTKRVLARNRQQLAAANRSGSGLVSGGVQASIGNEAYSDIRTAQLQYETFIANQRHQANRALINASVNAASQIISSHSTGLKEMERNKKFNADDDGGLDADELTVGGNSPAEGGPRSARIQRAYQRRRANGPQRFS